MIQKKRLHVISQCIRPKTSLIILWLHEQKENEKICLPVYSEKFSTGSQMFSL